MMYKLFEYGKVYLSDDKGNIVGPYKSTVEASLYAVENDTILIALDPLVGRKKPKKTVTGITLNFNDNTVDIKGAACCGYEEGTASIKDEDLKEPLKLIDKCYSAFKDTEVIGVPPIAGECLDALLYM